MGGYYVRPHCDVFGYWCCLSPGTHDWRTSHNKTPSWTPMGVFVDRIACVNLARLCAVPLSKVLLIPCVSSALDRSIKGFSFKKGKHHHVTSRYP